MLHAAFGLLLLPPMWRGGGPAAEAPLIEVELIQQQPMQQGGAAAEAAPPPPLDSPALDAGGDGGVPPPASPTPPGRQGSPAVNLGDGDRSQDDLSVTGENIVPPAPDAVFRNRPPSYPPDAARRGAEGTVRLLVRVSALGRPDQVLVAGSSGTASLDRAAREAVLLWRFRPARAGATPVPFDYQLNIRFTTGDR